MNTDHLQTITQNFLEELQKAHKGAKTSLPFIIHNLPERSLVKPNEIFQVLVIGGSSFQKALVKKQESSISILKKETAQLPKFTTKQTFLEFIEKKLSNNVEKVAINFAYPLSPDGVLLHGSKEHAFHGLTGKKVAQEIEKYLFEKLKKNIHVTVANDTVCLLLSGLSIASRQNLACGVIGTGINFAFFLGNKSLVNLESANFDKLTTSENGKEIDKTSANPKKALFEKEVSGAYLYRHFNVLLQQNNQGKRSPRHAFGGARDDRECETRDNLQFEPIDSTEKLSSIAQKNIPHISDIAKNLLNYSASLASCQIAGITLLKQSDMNFVMEGSLFWKGYRYKETVEKYVKKLASPFKVSFIRVENSAIIGASKLLA